MRNRRTAECVHEGSDHRTQRDDSAELSDDFLFADVRLECLLQETRKRDC